MQEVSNELYFYSGWGVGEDTSNLSWASNLLLGLENETYASKHTLPISERIMLLITNSKIKLKGRNAWLLWGFFFHISKMKHLIMHSVISL